jgi:hypothetical protein
MANVLTPSTAAYKFTHILNAFALAHGTSRFPVDVVALAKDAANQHQWDDPIAKVEAADLKNFEGGLFPVDDKRRWLLLYNSKLTSPGRIRFTQAHELGHYMLHRLQKEEFNCSADDVINRGQDETDMEFQADAFAGNLLMPLDDFRTQMDGAADLNALGACAERYGTSLTATILRWLKYTEKKAVLVVHRDGFMDWAFSSKTAFRSGAFFKTKHEIIAIPNNSIAADDNVPHERIGLEVAARTWFPHAPADLSLQEMKITASEYGSLMTLLVLPSGADVWKPKDWSSY